MREGRATATTEAWKVNIAVAAGITTGVVHRLRVVGGTARLSDNRHCSLVLFGSYVGSAEKTMKDGDPRNPLFGRLPGPDPQWTRHDG